MGAALTHLVPIQELTPGAVGAIRNQVINAVVEQVCRELHLTQDQLVVRDVRPLGDLSMYGAATTVTTTETWQFEATGQAANTWHAACGANTMADQRYVAFYGIRNGTSIGLHATLEDTMTSATARTGASAVFFQPIGLVKINVGGADKVIWDVRGLAAYADRQVAFAPSAVIIPQNAAYRIYYSYVTAMPGSKSRLQLIGVAVEPRGKLISP